LRNRPGAPEPGAPGFFRKNVNTRTPAARLVLALAALTLTPFGFRVAGAALAEPNPHLMVMLVFSGSLAALAGLAAGVGLVASLRPEHEDAPSPKEKGPC
jgi:predicted metalloprotease with PDZ domain